MKTNIVVPLAITSVVVATTIAVVLRRKYLEKKKASDNILVEQLTQIVGDDEKQKGFTAV